MSLRRRLVALTLTISAGSLIAVIASNGEVLSARTWFIGSFIAFVALLAYDLLRFTPIEPLRIHPLVRWRPPETDHRPDHNVRSAEMAITRSIADSRIFGHRLRPRLAEMADHFLEIGPGIDREHDPDRAIAYLGDEAWLTSAAFTNRAPTSEELERFFDTIGAPASDPPQRSREDRRGSPA